MALGSHKLMRIEPSAYPLLVKQAVDEGITVIEAAQDEGANALADALLGYQGQNRLTVLQRLGYNVSIAPEEEQLSSDTIVVDTVSLGGVPNDTGTETGTETAQVVHRLNGSAVETFLNESPLMDLTEENLQIIPMIHNPEEHQADTLSRLTDAFCGLEEAVSANKIPYFGVVSNGLALPPDHPLHLNWKSTVLRAACDAAKQTSKQNSSLGIVELPANVLETRGLRVARDIQSYIKGADATPFLPTNLEIYLMRPLTCFPDQGTGQGHGFQLIDYPLPTEPGVTEWTHTMTQPPPVYPATYKTAVSYFDATEILEAKQVRELTDEEEQTLVGAKILLDMIQGLDVDLEGLRSFAQHEQELMATVMPIIDGKFEEIDEESLEVLQNFFAALGLTARYHIARNTRSLLVKGGEGVDPYDIPAGMKMQDFAIRELLKEKVVSKIVVGATKPDHVRDTVEIFKEHDKI